MNISYDAYKIFYTVANCGSISKGAEELLISQPAVSWQIRTLEGQLGLTLFVRTKKGVNLTEEGKILFEFIKNGIESFTNAENILTNLKNMDTGTIRIGASTTVSQYVLIPYLEQFHKTYPNIKIEITNNLTIELVKLLKKGSLDLLLLNLPYSQDKELKIQNVSKLQDIFVSNKAFYEKINGLIQLNELIKYPLIFQKKPSNTRAFLDSYLKNNNINIKPSMEVVSYNLIMDLVKIGFGIGYATKEFVLDDLKNKTLYEIHVEPAIPERNIGLVTLKNIVPSFCTQKLINLIIKKLK